MHTSVVYMQQKCLWGDLSGKRMIGVILQIYDRKKFDDPMTTATHSKHCIINLFSLKKAACQMPTNKTLLHVHVYKHRRQFYEHTETLQRHLRTLYNLTT